MRRIKLCKLRRNRGAVQENGLSASVKPLVKFIEADFAAESVTVNAEQASGARLVALGAVQHAFNKFFLELVYGFVKKDSAIHHLPDQIFQLIFHDRTLQTKINFGRTRRTGCLVQFSSR